MNNWKVIFASVVIFGAGVITGGLLVNHVQHCSGKAVHGKPAALAEARPQATNQPPHSPDGNKPVRPAEILSKQFLQQLDTQLSLTSGQRAAIQKIIGERQTQIRKVVQDARREIREVLTPEQREQFDELVKRSVRRPNAGTNGPVESLSAPAVTSTNTP